MSDTVYTALTWTAIAFAVVLTIGGIWFYLWLQRPHLPNSTPSGLLPAAFRGELREQAFLRVFEEYGKTCEVEGFVVTCDPGLIKTLMVTPAHTKKRSRFYKLSSYLLYGMSGLLDLDGDEWIKHKRALYPLFHFSNVDRFSDDFHKTMSKHADAWARGQDAVDGVLDTDSPGKAEVGVTHPDLVAACRAAGLEGLAYFAIRMDASSERGQALCRQLTLYGKHLQRMGDGADGPVLSLPLGIWRVVSCTNNIRGLVHDETVERFGAPTKQQATEEQIAKVQAAEEVDSGPTTRVPIDGLRAMWLADFTANEIASEVNHVHGAHKAAGFSLACALWRLSRPENKAWLEKLRAEWEKELGPPGVEAPKLARTATPSRTSSKALVLTQAFVREVQRLHVVSLCTGRRTGEPLTIDGVKLPTGTEIGICLQALHTHPDHFSLPLEFRPERWLAADHPLHSKDVTADSKAFLPFLSGPRKCAGQQLAEMELVTGIHAVFDRYNISTDAETLRMRPDLYASHETPITFACTPRTD